MKSIEEIREILSQEGTDLESIEIKVDKDNKPYIQFKSNNGIYKVKIINTEINLLDMKEQLIDYLSQVYEEDNIEISLLRRRIK